jgi:hypothetical protein
LNVDRDDVVLVIVVIDDGGGGGCYFIRERWWQLSAVELVNFFDEEKIEYIMERLSADACDSIVFCE